MNKQEILAFLNANPIGFLATVDGNVPRVRGMMIFRADESGLLFHSGEGKEMTAQMRRNPAVEYCAWNPQQGIQVRVSGVAEFVDDRALKEHVVAERPFLQPVVEQTGYEAFLLFRIVNCTATVWTMADNLAPKTYIPLT